MKRNNRSVFVLLMTLLLIQTCTSCVFAESAGSHPMLSGEFETPVNINLSEFSFGKISQFGQERTESLNRLLSHISLNIRMDQNDSETTVLIDEDPLFTVSSMTDRETTGSVFSFNPGQIYINYGKEEKEDDYFLFLEHHFFPINRLMDEMYAFFEKTGISFPEYTKPGSSGMQYKGFGKAVRKITIQFPSDIVRDKFPGILSGLCDSEECRHFIEQMSYQGTQKITLQYDQDQKLMCVNYNGAVGMNADNMRRVSLTWKCKRNNECIKDNLSLKTPSIQGFDKYNISFTREEILNHDEMQQIQWDYQIDLKNNDVKEKTQYIAQLSESEGVISGEISYEERQNGTTDRLQITPKIRKENGSSYDGTIEISRKKGKIETSRIRSRFSVESSPMYHITRKDGMELHSENTDDEHTADILNEKMYGIILQKLVTLPQSDTGFLRQDIPEELWQSIGLSMQ